MIIDLLSKHGGLANPSFEKTSFEWLPLDADSPITFEISVQADPTVADFEFIQFGDMLADDRSIMARRIHRLVRVHSINGESVEPGTEQMRLEDIKRFKPSLLTAFVTAINKVDVELGKPKAPTKTPVKPKTRRRSTPSKSSGTS